MSAVLVVKASHRIGKMCFFSTRCVLIATDKWFFCFVPRVLWLKCQCGDHVSWSRSSVAYLSASSIYQGSQLMWAGTTAFHILFSSLFNRIPFFCCGSSFHHGPWPPHYWGF